MAMAWSRISSKVMADPPPAVRRARYRAGNVDPSWPLCTAKHQPRKARNAEAYGAEETHAPGREGMAFVARTCTCFSRTKLEFITVYGLWYAVPQRWSTGLISSDSSMAFT